MTTRQARLVRRSKNYRRKLSLSGSITVPIRGPLYNVRQLLAGPVTEYKYIARPSEIVGSSTIWDTQYATLWKEYRIILWEVEVIRQFPANVQDLGGERRQPMYYEVLKSIDPPAWTTPGYLPSDDPVTRFTRRDRFKFKFVPWITANSSGNLRNTTVGFSARAYGKWLSTGDYALTGLGNPGEMDYYGWRFLKPSDATGEEPIHYVNNTFWFQFRGPKNPAK